MKHELHQTYNANFDRRDYREIHSLKRANPEEYQIKKVLLDSKVLYNLYTMLGERYNAGISTREDRILHGEIVGAHSDEPLLNVFIRGRDFRFPDSSEHDRKRENAEVEGFGKIQALLGQENTPIGTMMLSISPPGGEDSQYKHNFYDVFTLKEDERGRVIEVSRFSSALENEDYRAVASSLQPSYFEEQEITGLPVDAYFLTKPIVIKPGERDISSSDDIHRLLHADHEVTSLDKLNAISQGSHSLALAYINVLAENPEAMLDSNLALNAYLNHSDYLRDLLDDKLEMKTIFDQQKNAPTSWEDIRRLGRQEVRAVTTGCGVSGGFAVDSSAGITGGVYVGAAESNYSPYSVVEYGYGVDKYGSRTFKCHHCNFENLRPKDTLIENCQNKQKDNDGKLKCGKSVRCD